MVPIPLDTVLAVTFAVIFVVFFYVFVCLSDGPFLWCPGNRFKVCTIWHIAFLLVLKHLHVFLNDWLAHWQATEKSNASGAFLFEHQQAWLMECVCQWPWVMPEQKSKRCLTIREVWCRLYAWDCMYHFICNCRQLQIGHTHFVQKVLKNDEEHFRMTSGQWLDLTAILLAHSKSVKGRFGIFSVQQIRSVEWKLYPCYKEQLYCTWCDVAIS